MSHIKCRYNEIYCGALIYTQNRSAVVCDFHKCGQYLECDFMYVGGKEEYLCTCAHSAIVEFEKDVKSYEYTQDSNELKIGRKCYKYIEYLEIDGRVLMPENGGCENMSEQERWKKE